MEEKYYTPEQLAERFQVSRHAVYKWIRDGTLRAIRVGRAVRIPASALEEFIRPASEPYEGDERP
jgi:putative molybdopterin biosynthesis protein